MDTFKNAHAFRSVNLSCKLNLHLVKTTWGAQITLRSSSRRSWHREEGQAESHFEELEQVWDDRYAPRLGGFGGPM